MRQIRIGTRSSELALWQANYVKDRLLAVHKDLVVELVKIVTEGDRTLDAPLHQSGGKGLFLKELELALLKEEIDLAVHSMKDVTINLPEGLQIPVFCPREDPRDALVSNQHESLSTMPGGSLIGTCSLRRRCQLQAQYPHLEFQNLRGNINSRIRKLDAGLYDGIILAAAGLKRLGMDTRITETISPEISLPAVGQGIVGIECRKDAPDLMAYIKPLNDPDAAIQMETERQANAILNGGCQAPVAGYAEAVYQDGIKKLRLRFMVGELDGSKILKCERFGPYTLQNTLGREVACDLLRQGAGEMLKNFHAQHS